MARSAAKTVLKAAPNPKINVLIASHSHPHLSKGGAEIASYQLYRALRRSPDYESWYLGCVRDEQRQRLGATFSQPDSEREYLYAAGAFDWFKFANLDPKFPAEFRELLERLQPRIVHFHHYAIFGVEAFLHVREMLPSCRIVVTLHEYLALCHHYGQMITKSTRGLCSDSSPVRCSACFPEHSPSDFFLRNLYIKRFFALVDCFLAPSHFLAERYIAWGLPPERVKVIENVLGGTQDAPNLKVHRLKGLLRVGFFGQISVLKGINVLFDCAEMLAERKVHDIVFEIYGDHSNQPPEFQAEFLQRLAKAGRNIHFHGDYEQMQVDRLMQCVDVVLVPSIWWENSPVVIEEALRNRRPVVCSNIGGMAEKVRDGLDGFHFPVRNSAALGALLTSLAGKSEALKGIAATLRLPADLKDSAARHQEVYASLLSPANV
jgi:glycosyltransferase involved in cell wall biosynthesis